MFIDFLPLMLINMAGGLCVLAHFVLKGLAGDDHRPWAPAFAMTGLVAFICGLHMIFTWPLPGSYNVAFGECSVLFGTVFLGGALAMGKGWKLDAVALYALVAGAAAILVGARIAHLGLTQMPLATGIGFMLTGAGGLFAYPALRLRGSLLVRVLGAICMKLAALLWFAIGAFGYWMHLASLSKWTPLIFQKAL